jgi:phosphate acetyltransferase
MSSACSATAAGRTARRNHPLSASGVGKDVLIVEGMVPTRSASYAARVNLHLAKSLDAEVILVSAPENEVLRTVRPRRVAGPAVRRPARPESARGDPQQGRPTTTHGGAFAARLQEHSPLLRGDFRLLGCILPADLNAPRTRDVADLLGARCSTPATTSSGACRRSSSARPRRNTVQLLKPGVLVVVPGDRDDIILAVSLAAMNGVPLAGLLLTSGLPDPRIMELCRSALQAACRCCR